jgi:hypothetical protein
MDDVASNIIDRETQLADFDHARDDFEQAFAQVPEDGLDYKPEGDDYSLRDLVTHVANSMIMYNALLDDIERVDYQELRLVATGEFGPDVPHQRIRDREQLPPRSADKTGTLDQMEEVHDKLAARLREMAQENYVRQAPVYYVGSDQPYPTAASDIIGWLTDHYREHVPHIAQMLEGHRSKKSG